MGLRKSLSLGVRLGALVVTASAVALATAWAEGEDIPASAVTFHLDKENVEFAPDGSSVAVERIEIRANNEAGIDLASRRTASYDSLMGNVEVVEAHTLKADGTVIPVAPAAIFERQPQGDGAVLSGQMEKVILFPQFEAGDMAVYTLKRTLNHVYFPGRITFGFHLDPKTQIDELQETVKVPNSLGVQVETHGLDLAKVSDGGFTTYTWRYNAHDLTPREVIPVSPLMRMPRFYLSSFKSFDEVAAAYASLAAPKITVTPEIAKLADQITQGEKKRRVQAQKLYEWVARHIRYVALEFGAGSMVPHDAGTILANGYGDCKDHDALFQALLKAKGIKAQSVLINYGAEYSLTEVPNTATLNHAITYLPEFDLYADSTAAVAPFGVLPFEEYGKPVLLAGTRSFRGTTPLVQPGQVSMETATDVTLAPDGSLSGTTRSKATGPSAIWLRGRAISIQRMRPAQAAANELTASGYDHGSGTFQVGTPKALSDSYEVKGEFRAEGWSERLRGKPFGMPRGLPLLAVPGDGPMGPLSPGQLKDNEPTKCFSEHQSDSIALHIPAHLRLAEMPKNMDVETANLHFSARWSFADNTLRVQREFTSNIQSPICTGKVREDSAAALKKIREHYREQLKLVAGETAH